MRITCIGGGPAGLFTAVLARLAGHEVEVFERLPTATSQGWGVVFWDDLLASLRVADPVFADALAEAAFRWTDEVISVDAAAPVVASSAGYSIGRHRLLQMLADRADGLGAELRFGERAPELSALATRDLVVAADGVRSATRSALPGFGTRMKTGRNRYAWLGTDRVFDSFRFPVRSTPQGAVWAHAYGFGDGMSTFVVETTPETWAGEGFGEMDDDATLRRLEAIFAADLGGRPLLRVPGAASASFWNRFTDVTNGRWYSGRVALAGDAAHTTHFSIGSGTRLALEDAIGLAEALAAHASIEPALEAYSRDRRRALAGVQQEARRSARWFESLPRYMGAGADGFATLLESRRSRVLPHLPPAAYLRLSGTARSLLRRSPTPGQDRSA